MIDRKMKKEVNGKDVIIITITSALILMMLSTTILWLQQTVAFAQEEEVFWINPEIVPTINELLIVSSNSPDYAKVINYVKIYDACIDDFDFDNQTIPADRCRDINYEMANTYCSLDAFDAKRCELIQTLIEYWRYRGFPPWVDPTQPLGPDNPAYNPRWDVETQRVVE